MIWWHRMKHVISSTRVSVPSFDASAKGLLIKCSCGKVWAK
jgi:hypothetical protein